MILSIDTLGTLIGIATVLGIVTGASCAGLYVLIRRW